MRRPLALGVTACLFLAACAGGDADQDDQESSAETGEPTTPQDSADQDDTDAADPVTEFDVVTHDQFGAPWALEFLPGTDALLITERTGTLHVRDQGSGDVSEVSGVPDVVSDGQGGLHDVIAGPTFDQDGTVYLSWVRSTDGASQGVVGRGHLDQDTATLNDLEVIWEQDPAPGDGHFALRMTVLDEALYVTSGDRQELQPAQEMDTNLGTIVRLTLDGDAHPENPFADDGGVAAQFWTTGHRNPLGIATDSQGNLWSSEMGPQGGDELNLILEGANYGWPEVSEGAHYSGEDIPDHNDSYEAPRASWVPAISPGNLLIYSGDLFTGWQDTAVLGGLSGQNLVRVDLDGHDALPADEWDMSDRIRDVAEAPDGAIWVATDSGDLNELRPAH